MTLGGGAGSGWARGPRPGLPQPARAPPPRPPLPPPPHAPPAAASFPSSLMPLVHFSLGPCSVTLLKARCVLGVADAGMSQARPLPPEVADGPREVAQAAWRR